MNELQLIDIDTLRIHEEVDESHVARVMKSMGETERFDPPIIIDIETRLILDGHHRYWAARRMGCRRIPCYCVDYLNDDSVVLKSWRPGEIISKEDVVRMGLSDNIFPQKTTRHLYDCPDFPPTPLSALMNSAE